MRRFKAGSHWITYARIHTLTNTWIIKYCTSSSSFFFFCCRLNQTYRQLLSDNELLTADHKHLKSQLNEAKLEHTWLEADFSKLKKEFQQLDITSTKLTNQCEVLTCSRWRNKLNKPSVSVYHV